MNSLLNNKTINSYITLESAINSFYFISLRPSNSKNTRRNKPVQGINSSRVSLSGPVISLKPTADAEDRVTVRRIRLEPSPRNKSKIDTPGNVTKPYTPFVTDHRNGSSVSRMGSDKKTELTKPSKFNEYSSEIVNIYRKPLYGWIIRIK